MPLGTNFGGAISGFQNLANAGLFGKEKTEVIAFNNAGNSSSLLGQFLDVANFGLDVFQTVRGGNSAPAQAPAVSVASSSTVPTPSGVVSRFTGNFSPSGIGNAAATGMASTRGLAALGAGAVAGARSGVALILRVIKNNTGVSMTSKKFAKLAREFGISVVATWAGIELADAMIVWSRGSKRVRRRITKRDRSRGRSYIRYLKKNADELKSLGCGPKSVVRRRKC